MTNLAIFASGSGTNAENIANYFNSNKDVNIKLILSNNAEAYVLRRAKKLNIETATFTKEDFYKSRKVITLLQDNSIDFIVLAGFMWLVPTSLISEYPNKIVNIHPALLPNYGGKGMYGDFVHKAIIKNKETESGITIHYVNENYDEGSIIFQDKCSIDKTDTAETLANKIHVLEHNSYPKIIKQILKNV